MLLSLRLSVLGFLLLSACVTSEEQPQVPKAGRKTYDACVCGPLSNQDGQPQCAIWSRTPGSPEQPQKAYAGRASASCEAADCSRLFSALCQKIEMAPRPAPAPAPVVAADGCYCDTVLIENEKGQVRKLCAAWTDNSSQLIEYYSLDDCSPGRCQKAPFRLASSVCKDNFKPFYLSGKIR